MSDTPKVDRRKPTDYSQADISAQVEIVFDLPPYKGKHAKQNPK